MPLSITDFMDIQLRKLARLCWLNLLSQPFNPLIEACLTGRVPVDMLMAVYLIRLCSDVHEITKQTSQVIANNY